MTRSVITASVRRHDTSGLAVRALLALLALTLLLGGCVTHHAATVASRFVKRGEPTATLDAAVASADRTAADRAADRAADGTAAAARAEMARALAAAVPPLREAAPSIEEREPDLAEARQRWRAAETAGTARQVAAAYRRLNVLDAAHEYYSRAVALDRADASSYDALARIWRDWGMAHLGLADAYRAVYHAPTSAEVHNTLGTMLAARGRWSAARAEFGRALALDPSAAYAAHNLLVVDRAEVEEGAVHEPR